jgi:hypothetical protein
MGATPVQQEDLPPFPFIYRGDITVAGKPVGEGFSVFACVGGCGAGGWKSKEVPVEHSSYRTLIVGPPNRTFLTKQITFYLTRGFGDVQAAQVDVYEERGSPPRPVSITKDLSFASEPPGPPVAATPTPTPTPALPITGDPSVAILPGIILLAGLSLIVVGGLLVIALRRRTAA